MTFRFQEDDSFREVLAYIAGTYDQHYAHEVAGKNIQVIDMWEAAGSLGTTSRDTAQKYLARFGKKDGYNKKDLFKAIHYILLMLYDTKQKESAADGLATSLGNPKLIDKHTGTTSSKPYNAHPAFKGDEWLMEGGWKL